MGAPAADPAYLRRVVAAGRSHDAVVIAPPRDGVYVLWTLPPVDPAYLRRVVADVRARLAARASRASR